MSSYKTGFYTKMHPLREDQQESVGLIGRKSIGYAIIRDEVAPLEPTLSGCQGSRGGTGVPPVTVMARMAMPQGSAHADVAPPFRAAHAGLKPGATMAAALHDVSETKGVSRLE